MAPLTLQRAAAAIAVALPSVIATSQLPSGVIAVPLTRNEDLTEYFAELHVGTPPQKQLLKIDTGSPRFSFLDPRNPICEREGDPCVKYGNFNNETSSTSEYEGFGFQDALGYVGRGDYLSDTVEIGGVSIEDMYFGMTSDYSFPDKLSGDIRTILGLSLECSLAGPECIDRFSAYFLPELKKTSKISHIASSIYLGPDDLDASGAQMLLGGAYDRAKFTGDLITIPMADPFNLSLTGGQTNSVNVTSIEVTLGNGEGQSANSTVEKYGQEGEGVSVLLDTGVASFYLTEKTLAPIYHAFGDVEAPPFGQQYQTVDCKYSDPSRSDGHITVEFGPHGKISIPFHGLVSKFPDETCGIFLTSRGDELSIFGDPFLRGVYGIFDQENFTISLGEVRHTDEEDIVPFPEGGFKTT